MKKKLLLSTILVICLLVVMTGCGNSKPYSGYDLAEYITLPDYSSYETNVPEVSISDADIDAEIQNILEEAATTESITEGTVAQGDTVKISFKGTLKDGSSPEGMNSDSYSLTLGSGTMIEGFESGLYGATIGQPVTLELQFPDPYQNNEELSGQDVTFVVTVLSKENKVLPEFNLDFVKEKSDFETIEDYRANLESELSRKSYDEQLYAIKSELYSKIVSETTVIKYPDKEVKEQVKSLNKSYKDTADQYGYEWEEFMKTQLGVTDQSQYDETIKSYAQEIVKQEMVIYMVAEKEGIEVTDKEYNEYLQQNLASAGFEDEKAFKEYTGMSLKKYAKEYKLDRDLLLTKELDLIYGRLAEEK